MIVRPDEVDVLAAFLDEFERQTVWSRAIHLAIRDCNVGDAPETVAKVIMSHLTPDEIRAQQPQNMMDSMAILAYLRANPHLLIPAGFDEVRVEKKPADDLALAFHKELARRSPTAGDADTYRLPGHDAFEFMLGIHCRQLSSGVWYHGAAFDLADYSLTLRPASVGHPFKRTLRNILADCRSSIQGDAYPAVLLLPGLWYPPTTQPTIQIADTTRDLVIALAQESKDLEDLSWQQLEDVVAELLRARGLEVSITPRSNDGGRDIVARGELIPGETALLAVEVKHRPVVKIGEIRAHLHANRDFPLLLVATSGRFSAGVIKEKKKPENFLRLHLKSGDGLKSWIREYRP